MGFIGRLHWSRLHEGISGGVESAAPDLAVRQESFRFRGRKARRVIARARRSRVAEGAGTHIVVLDGIYRAELT